MAQPRITGRIAAAAALVHALAFVTLHLLEPELGISSSIISDYGATDSAWLATLAFLAFGTLWGTLALALSEAKPSGRLLDVARLLFLLAAVSIVATAFFPAEADPRTGSLFSRVQNVLSRPGLFLGIVLASVGLRTAAPWKEVGSALIVLSAACVVLLIATIAFLLEAGFGGYSQRAIFVLIYAWVLLVSSPLWRTTSGSRG